ncbi:MAG: Nif3-like dinuclear metal center hexameric protein [Candidatus Aminicenantes bacterium]|nr:Nif3-like dinuclear metal center hexameric protein [Candidatus Aminicenantes bacterium]
MVLRDELNSYLAELYRFENFEDYCENGLQVEGKEQIEKIVFAVSFNLHLVEKAIEQKADAIIVHHGIFGKGLFVLTGHKKKKIKMLLEHEISLFGIHLPMDAHPRLGHNALLLAALGAASIEPFGIGFTGENVKKYSLNRILEIFHEQLHDRNFEEKEIKNGIFSFFKRKGFAVLNNGPEIPGRIALISGAASDLYEKAVENGADTFICGDIKEHIPALSYETGTNFINLGHYYSEKPGVLELMKHIRENFAVETEYVEIPNPV